MENDNQPIPKEEWDRIVASVPNALIRGSLFCAQKLGEERPLVDDMQIETQRNYRILFSGRRLNQTDGMLFYAMVRLAKRKGCKPNDHVHFSTRELVDEMGVQDGGYMHKFVNLSMDRLKKASIKLVANNGRTWSGSFVNEYLLCPDGSDAQYFVLGTKVHSLYSCDTTSINHRLKAGLRSPIARWLADFYTTHDRPIPIDYREIKRICGSDLPDKSFKRQLRVAMDSIADSDGCPFVGWKMDGDMVKVYRRAGDNARAIAVENEDDAIQRVMAEMSSKQNGG